jgi:hypothetical protein
MNTERSSQACSKLESDHNLLCHSISKRRSLYSHALLSSKIHVCFLRNTRINQPIILAKHGIILTLYSIQFKSIRVYLRANLTAQRPITKLQNYINNNYIIVTDFINALPDNSSVNMVQQATNSCVFCRSDRRPTDWLDSEARKRQYFVLVRQILPVTAKTDLLLLPIP